MTGTTKRVFISMPMAGLSDEEIRARIDTILNNLSRSLDSPVTCINYIDDGVQRSALEYLGESLKLMEQADVIFFANGWVGARGCNVEHLAATHYHGDRVVLYEADCAKASHEQWLRWNTLVNG